MVDGINSFNVIGQDGGQKTVTGKNSLYKKKLNSLFGGQKQVGDTQNVSQQQSLKRLDSGVTKNNNEYSIFKDEQGNSVYRVDYCNNNPQNVFDEEEVRSSDGKLLSYTERYYGVEVTKNGYTETGMEYRKREFDENGNMTKITVVSCDASGNPIKTEDIPLEQAEVSDRDIGVPLNPNSGDSGLKEIMSKWGAVLTGKK